MKTNSKHGLLPKTFSPGGKIASKKLSNMRKKEQKRFKMSSWSYPRWVECIVSEPNYFSLNSDYCPLHLALLDEVVSNHPLLHARVLSLFTSLFEGSYGRDRPYIFI